MNPPSRQMESRPSGMPKQLWWTTWLIQNRKMNHNITFNYRNVPEGIPAPRLERADDVLEYLADPRHRVFLQADLKHAYYSIPLAMDCRHIYAFSVDGLGQLQPTRSPQGCVGGTFTMSSLMNMVLGRIPGPEPEPSLLHSATVDKPEPCKFYMNHIVAGSNSFEELYEFLEQHVLPRVLWSGLKLSFKKLKLFVPNVTALGVSHEVGGKVRITPSCTEKISRWPVPESRRDVRAFLGAVGITRRWVKNFADLARPLSRLTGEATWKWSDSQQLSFDILKIKCATSGDIHGFDWQQPAIMFTDASQFGLRMVFMQEREDSSRAGKKMLVPIVFDAFTLSKTEQRYSTSKTELYAIVKALRKHGHYCSGTNCPGTIYTDHKPLLYFLDSENHEETYARWVFEL